MRGIERLTGHSINTISKLLTNAGNVCAHYHDQHVRNIEGFRRIECDEIWAFVYAKDKNIANAKTAPDGSGSVWTWTALDADSKLLVSYLVSSLRDVASAKKFMWDLCVRLQNRPQLSTDGLRHYVAAVKRAFGEYVEFAQIIKSFEDDPDKRKLRIEESSTQVRVEKTRIFGYPDMDTVGTSYVERHNLTMRMSMRRFARLTNAFSKRIEKHYAMVALYTLHYNFCRVHSSLHVTPAMATGLTSKLRDCEWIVGLIDEASPRPKRPGPRKGSKYRPRSSSES